MAMPWMKWLEPSPVWKPMVFLPGYQFAPVTDHNGNVVLKYTVVDGSGPGIAGSLNLAVDAVNDTPVPTFAINQVALGSR